MYKMRTNKQYTLKECIEAKKEYGYCAKYVFVSSGIGFLSMECSIFRSPYPKHFCSKCFKFKSIKIAWNKNFSDEELI